jgi:hypothetical protein
MPNNNEKQRTQIQHQMWDRKSGHDHCNTHTDQQYMALKVLT